MQTGFSLLAALGDSIIVTVGDGHGGGEVVFANAAAGRLLGCAEGSLVGAAAAELFPAGVPSADGAIRLRSPGGGEVEVDAMVATVRDGGCDLVILTLRPAHAAALAALRQEADEARLRFARLGRHIALRADVATALATAATMDDMLAGATDAIVRHLDAAFARVWLLDASGTVLELRASSGMYTHKDGPHSRVRVGHLKIGRIAETRRPHQSNDVPHDPQVSDQEWARREGMVAFAGHPLIAGERLVGVLAMFAREAQSVDALDALGSVAASLAQGVERRRAEEALRRSRDQLRAILGGVAEGITVQDRAGRLVYANDAAALLSGYAGAEEMLRAPLGEVQRRFLIMDEAGAPIPYERLPGRRAVVAGESTQATVRVRAIATGDEHIVMAAATPIFDEHGWPELAVSVLRDVTADRRREDAWRFLAEASGLLGSSLDYTTTLAAVARLAVPRLADWCAVEIAGEDGRGIERLAVAHVDPQKVAMAEEVRRRWPPDPDAPTGVAAVIRTGRSEWVPEITDAMLDASIADVEYRELLRGLGLRSVMTVPLSASGRTFGAISFVAAESGRCYDAADLAFAEELARRAALAIDNARLYRMAQNAIDLRETFLSIASHELKTPLTTLMLQAQSLERGVLQGTLAPERLPQRVSILWRQAVRLNALVDELLNVSRLAAGRLELRLHECSLAQVAEEVAQRFSDEAERAGCRITVAAADPAPGLWDRLRLDQVITNLLSNAIKYGRGRPIDVSVASDGDVARLMVRDEGIGIAAENQARIFERFERVVSERQYGGFGLGLWIVREIVSALGGSIRVVSEPDRGANFIVELPRRPRVAEEPAPATH